MSAYAEIDWSKRRVWSAEAIKREEASIYGHEAAPGPWAAYLDRERRRRSWLSAVTFGIELRDAAIVLQVDWERAAEKIDPRVGVCDPEIDEFFRTQFSPMTTRWVRQHPDLEAVGVKFDRYQSIMGGCFNFDRPEYRPLVMRRR